MKVLLVGAGGAGALNKSTTINNIEIFRNHLDVLTKFKNLDLIVVDSSKHILRKVKKKYYSKSKRIKYLLNLDDVPNEKIDLAIISTPPNIRLILLKKLSNLNCRLFIIEKPLSDNIKESKRIIKFAESNKIKLIINYPRRFDDAVKKILKTKQVPTRIVCYYSKGVLNYGSHLIDFLIHLFGSFSKIEKLKFDKSESPSFNLLTKSKIPISIIGIDSIQYDQFEISLFYKARKLQIRNGGLEIKTFTSQPNLLIDSYSHLQETKNSSDFTINNCFSNLYNKLIKNNKINEYFEFQNLREILYVYEIINKIKN